MPKPLWYHDFANYDHKGSDMNIKDFIKLDFKMIIAEMSKIRKGVAMIILVICIMLALVDRYILHNHFNPATANIFQNIYSLGIIFSFTALLIKIYNEFCDEKDRKKEIEKAEKEAEEKELKELEKKEKNREKYRQLFDYCNKEELIILKRFCKENSTSVYVNWEEYNIVNAMVAKGITIISTQPRDTYYSGTAYTTPNGLEFIKNYFKNKSKK